MPDNDMGTAHGKFKLTGETRGADQVNRALNGFQKAIEMIAGRLGGFISAMDKMDSELRQAKDEFDAATKAADKYDRAIDGVNRETLKFSRSNKEFAGTLKDVHDRLRLVNDAAHSYIIPLSQVVKVTREFNRSGGGLKGLFQSLGRAGAAGAVLQMIKSHFIGIGAALQKAPAWNQQLARMANSFGLFTLAASRATGLVSSSGRILERFFINTTKGAEGADFALAGFRNTVGRFTEGISSALSPVQSFLRHLDRIPKGAFEVAGGLAIMRSGINDLRTRFTVLNAAMGFLNNSPWGKALKFVLLPGIIASAAAVQTFDKALVFLSNTMAGLWSGTKQLAGGFLAIPGLIATVGAAALPLVAIVKTIKDNIKDLVKASDANDPKKFAEALAQIPPYLRPLALAIVDVIPKIKSLGDILTATFVSGGLDTQLRKLVGTYLPALSIGAIQVANSWKILLNHVLEFASEAQTIGDVNHLFMNTSQIMNTIGDSIKPVLNGLRDIGIVGSTFIRNLAEDYLPGIADRFANWANNARQTGRMMDWMTGSVHAAKDLYHGFDDLVRATWKLLTLFQTKSGDSFLDRFAASMKKFHETVNNSASGGELKKIADVVKGMGDDKIKQFIELFKQFLPILREAIKTLSDMGAAFSAVMVPAIQAFMTVFTPMIKAFNSIGGGTIIGSILGIVGAFKLLTAVVGPAWSLIRVFFGAFLTIRGTENIVLGLVGSLEKLGPVGQRAASGIMGIGDSLAKGLRSAGYAAAAFAVVVDVYLQGDQQIKDSQKAVADQAEHTAARVGKLRDAFISDKGAVGDNVVGALAQSVQTSMSDLQNTVQKGPGVMAHISDYLKRTFMSGRGFSGIGMFATLFGSESKGLNDLQDKAGEAGRILATTQQAMEATGTSADDLGKVVGGSTEAWNKWIFAISATGQGGATEETLKHWQAMRTEFETLQRSFAEAGPGSIMVAQGIAKMAAAAGDTTSKLSGLKMALQGLGLLKQDQYEAAANYAQAIRDLGDAAAHAADTSQPLGQAMKDLSGSIDVTTVNGRNLYNLLQPIAEKFLAAAAAGKNVNDLWANFAPQIHDLATQFGLADDDVLKFVQTLGMVPSIVDVLVKISANPDVMARELGQLLAKAAASVDNKLPVNIILNTTQEAQALAQKIQEIFHDVTAAKADGLNVWLKPGIDQHSLQVLTDYLKSKYNIDLGASGGPAVIPGLSDIQVPQPTGPPAPPLTPAPGSPATPPASSQPKVTTPAPGMALPPGLPAPLLPPTRNSRGQLIDPQTGVAGGPQGASPATPSVPAPNVPQAAGVDPNASGASLTQLNQINSALTVSAAAWTEYYQNVKKILDQIGPEIQKFCENASRQLGKVASDAKVSGAAFSANFAQGIRDGLPLVDAAAKAIALAAGNKMPGSPAKEGPLSGRGWSGYAGQAFSGDFAQGIAGGAGAVSQASSKVAGKARGALAASTPYGKFGFEFKGDGLGQIRNILSFAEHAVSAVSQVANIGMQVGKILMDPVGFFTGKGQNQTGGKNGPNAIGGILSGGAASLAGNGNPSKEDIAAAIGGEAQRRGYDRNTAISVISAAMQESGMNPNVTNASGHQSLFQTSADKGVGLNAGDQIRWMFNQLDALGGPNAAGLKNDPLDFIASQIEKGGYGGAALGQHSMAAANLYDRALAAGAQGGVGWAGAPSGAMSGKPANPPPNENAMRQWAQQMFGIPNSMGTGSWTNAAHPADQGLHGPGYAFDFHSDDKAQMAAMANYIATNLVGQTLELIYQGPGFDPSGLIKNGKLGAAGVYGAGVLGEHTDHVHWATDVAPILAGANANAMPAAAGVMPGQQQGQQSDQIFGDQPQQGQQSGLPGQDQSQMTMQQNGAQGTPQSAANQTQQMFGMIGTGISAATNIASDVIGTIQAGVDAWGATKYITDQLTRGISNTEDVFNMVDQFQKYVTFAAKIAQTTSDVLGQVGSVLGAGAGADPTGAASGAATALQGASQIASLISAGLSTFNAVIDLGQEAYRIWGSYFGQFLGFLTGGANSFMGDVKFLLDTNTKTLYNYTTDNPLNKQAHGLIPGAVLGTSSPGTNQVVGQLNYFSGAGEDPRDSVGRMMYGVKASQMAGATKQ